MTARRIRVFGHVQGVYFRGWTVEQARQLGVTGWVRNRRDGSVEIEAHGEEGQIQALVDCCSTGPPSARVERVTVEEAQGEAPDGFHSAPTH